METPSVTEPRWKLHGMYYLIQVSGLIVILALGILIRSFPEYFAFLRDVERIVPLTFSLFAVHLVLFVLRETFRKKFFFVVSRYVWAFFFLACVYLTGGVDSPFLFLLIFPLLASATDLDERATRIVGILITALFGGMIFFEPEFLADPSAVIKHGMRTALFGVISYYVYSIVKETLRQKYEKEEAKRKTAELLELDKVKTDFLTVAQHQLRTPLSALRWAFENLREGAAAAPGGKEIIEDGAKKVEDAIRIVNEMLRTAEMKTPSLTLARAPVPLSRAVRETLEGFAPLIARKGVRVVFSPPIEVIVPADLKLLKLALGSVLDNAVRYSPNGEVRITLASADGKAMLEVQDTGMGIAPDDMPYLFERFYRGRNAILMEPNESGVGLYLAKQIIERHGGTLSVHSQLGKGTTVTIELPLTN